MGEGAAWARGPEVENRVCPELAGAGTLEVGWAGLDQEDVECLGVFSSYSSVEICGIYCLVWEIGRSHLSHHACRNHRCAFLCLSLSVPPPPPTPHG